MVAAACAWNSGGCAENDGMRSSTAAGLIAGVHADRPVAGVPELAGIGDEWAPRGRPMGWHTHPVWEVYLQIDGTTIRSADHAAHPMAPGELFIAPPGARHRVVNQGSVSQHNGFVRCRLGSFLRRHPRAADAWSFSACRHLADGAGALPPFLQLMREVSLDQPFRAEGTRCALDGLLFAITRLLGRVPARMQLPVPTAVLEAQRRLEQSCARAWPLRVLAEQVALSPSHLMALFRQHLGMSPHRYLIAQRIARARHLLAFNDHAIGEVARELGFATSQHFARTFRAHTGSTASAYRRSQRGAAG
jgi:AraC-like DNA-binding protein